MNKIAIEAKKDFLERLSSAAPLKAVSELIWNGLDAGANQVEVKFEENPLGGIERIRVIDTGSGIDHSRIQSLFGGLGDSWKKKQARYAGRALHGKSGQGRFKAFALGAKVEWNTVYAANGTRKYFTVFGHGIALDDLQFSDPVEAGNRPLGTEVIISGIQKNLGILTGDRGRDEVAKQFAPYLSRYPDISINYDGILVDPSGLQSDKKEIHLDTIPLRDGSTVSATVTVIEWLMPTKRMIHLCDVDGVSLHETEAGPQIRAPGFEFTVYIKSDHFRELDKTGELVLEDMHPDVETIVHGARQAVKGHFRRKLAQRQSKIVERWKKEQIYPFEEKETLNPVEEAERQVFDILAVNVESYLPVFEGSDRKSKKFMFRLLSEALRDNPESVQKIISEMLNLKKEEQEALAELLEVTSLSNIISSAQTVANRLNFLTALDNLIFDKETKKKLLERDQLHKILEKEAWIFDEEFALSGSEKALEQILELHLGELRKPDDGPVFREDDQQGRVDLMLSRVVQPRHDERDHLVVELKRPSQRINSKILTQVESYAIAVASDPRFLKEKTRWKFIVVSNEMDDHARRKADQRGRKRGLVFDDGDLNIQVWAFEWTEVIANARARLQFINESLGYQASRESSRGYLEKAHAKFIPEPDAENGDEVLGKESDTKLTSSTAEEGNPQEVPAIRE